MPYATLEYYTEYYLLGRKPKIPVAEFPYWEKKASRFMDEFSLGRIDKNNPPESAKECACELAEHLYLNEGTENKSSESIAGHSATYIQGVEYSIMRRYLPVYRGIRYASTNSG